MTVLIILCGSISENRGVVDMKTKIEPMVNLNVNPCKMCMPMGAVTAFYGIKNCISIFHGSQGCSTYIRRHMATHYNEPVDIASSSLTEQGTVYGGEKNLIKGLENLIKLYNPQVIGVATTCLAETIGEDVPRIISNFYEKNPQYKDIVIIPVQTAGYEGTQFEGFFKAVCRVFDVVSMNKEKNEKINVITGPISPADTRFLKEALESFGLDYILFPDLSENLDGTHEKEYQRLPQSGTDIEDIKKMAGARFTIELSSVEHSVSPAKLLNQKFGIDYEVLNLPVGIRDCDKFYKLLSKLSGREIPENIKKQRGRYLDAMIDSHKYNGKAKAVIFGEPDFVVSTVRLCSENGVMPIVAATGSKCDSLENLVLGEMQKVSERYFIDEYKVLNDSDFKTIEFWAKKLEANLMIGNSDGRRIEENLNIPLVRRGFPIHDRVGGQRLRMMGYEGSLTFLDDIANAMLTRTETTFRKDVYDKYYKDEKKETSLISVKEKTEALKDIEEKTKNHPCFTCGEAHGSNARIHLPIAPKCNIQCNYCVRKFDCSNESRPGVTTKVLSPDEAFSRYKSVKEKLPNLTVVGIAGPGDSLANFEETKKTLEMIREYDPNVTFCISTNGLMLPTYAHEFPKLGISHVTVTINAVDPKIGGKIYKHITYMGQKFEGESAGAILLSNQLAGLRMLVSMGIICKVNIVMLKGINDSHIPEVVKCMKDIGCYITNIMPMIPVEGSAFEKVSMVSNKELNEMRNACSISMKQMYHCKQCRADAIGTLDNDLSIEFNKSCGGSKKEENKDLDKSENEFAKGYRFAVATKSGIIVDQHFGHVTEFYIYEYKNSEVIFKEKRNIEKYCEGVEYCGEKEDKIAKIISTISDCDGVIAMRIGDSPTRKLNDKGISVYTTYDRVSEAVKKAGLNIQALPV